jgi:hypothetical protein
MHFLFLISSANNCLDLRKAGHVARMKEMRNAYNNSVGKPEGNRSPGRPRRGWDDTIRMDLRERGWEVVEWIHLAKDRD